MHIAYRIGRPLCRCASLDRVQQPIIWLPVISFQGAILVAAKQGPRRDHRLPGGRRAGASSAKSPAGGLHRASSILDRLASVPIAHSLLQWVLGRA
jgi:hypothetical protein